MSAVEYTEVGTTAVITLNRPEARNAVDQPTAKALVEAFEQFEDNDDLLVAVLTGSSGVFCAGADLKAMGSDRANRVELTGHGPMGPTRHLLSKPVIAAVEGYAVAGGLELAIWCDLRVAARDAIFGVFCRRWGVPLIDGGTVLLPRLIGQSRALDMILTGRGVSGDEALQFGLVNRLTEPGGALAGALELAAELAQLPQNCLRSDRQSAYEQWNQPLGDALVRETQLGIEVLRSGESLAGARRFAEGAGRHGGTAPVV